jgi:hypothetical protein
VSYVEGLKVVQLLREENRLASDQEQWLLNTIHKLVSIYSTTGHADKSLPLLEKMLTWAKENLGPEDAGRP